MSGHFWRGVEVYSLSPLWAFKKEKLSFSFFGRMEGNYVLTFSYLTVASISLRSTPGRNWILFPLIWDAFTLLALSTPLLLITIWKLPKSPSLTIFPSARCFVRILVRSLSTASISLSDTVDPAAAISFARVLKLTSPLEFCFFSRFKRIFSLYDVILYRHLVFWLKNKDNFSLGIPEDFARRSWEKWGKGLREGLGADGWEMMMRNKRLNLK